MDNILMWFAIIGLGGFFCWLTGYSFYMILSSKNINQEPSHKTPAKTDDKKLKRKTAGRVQTLR